ncbi:MAG: penicillin-binding protein [Caulobacter sp. 35-67-4]|nr:MAG: penicillin-binding protein [Caulobacter sp. 32-67-35]OYX93437.1 MAG: penicillin-binding protein [Caulobacter sp. 35-67-4]
MTPLQPLYATLFALALAVAPCQAASPVSPPGTPAEAKDIDVFVRKALAQAQVVPGLSVTVVQADKVVMTEGYGVADLRTGRTVDADTGFYIASATKAFTALAIAAMAQRGELALDAPLSGWMGKSSLPADLASSTSLTDLLSHRSGLENEPIAFRAAYSGEHTPAGMSALLADTVRSQTTPQGTFSYTNAGYNLATVLIEDRFGRDWRTLVNREVLAPAGMTHTTARIDQARQKMLVAAGHTPGPDGPTAPSSLQKTNATMHSAGGLVSTARDMARWLEIQLNDGVVDGHRAFPPGLVASTHRPLATQQARFGPYTREGYGLGWQTGHYGTEALIHHFGNFAGSRAHVSFMPARGLGVAVMANEDLLAGELADLVANYVYDRFAGRPDLEAHYDAELAALTARRDKRVKGLAASRAERASRPWSLRLPTKSYVGDYRNPAMGSVQVVEEDGRMVIRAGVMASPAEAVPNPESVRVELIPLRGQTVRFETPGRLVFDGQTYVRR